MESYYTIGKYKISHMCFLTHPCKHYVENTYTYEITLMCGDEIYYMLKEEGLSNPHFNDYEEYVRKRDNPTIEEKEEMERKKINKR